MRSLSRVLGRSLCWLLLSGAVLVGHTSPALAEPPPNPNENGEPPNPDANGTGSGATMPAVALPISGSSAVLVITALSAGVVLIWAVPYVSFLYARSLVRRMAKVPK